MSAVNTNQETGNTVLSSAQSKHSVRRTLLNFSGPVLFADINSNIPTYQKILRHSQYNGMI